MSQAEATIIGQHTSIKGDLKIAGAVIIGGRIEGSITAEEVEIAQEGSVEGDIHAAVIDIHGTVNGKMTATRACRLGATASVHSQLTAATLSIADGARFVGQVYVGTEEQAPSESQDTAAAEEAAAVAAVTHTINRLETLAAQVDDAVRTAHVSAPAPAATPPAPQSHGPEIRVFPQTVQTLNRAPRIIKAR